jgi:hypothetical protein
VPNFYVAFGELREAHKRFASAGRNFELALLAFYTGDLRTTKVELPEVEGLERGSLPVAMLLMLHTGRLHEAEGARRRIDIPQEGRPGLAILDGELAIASGRRSKGMALLEQGLNASIGATLYLIAAEDLARLYREQHKLPEALRVLQHAASLPSAPNFQGASTCASSFGSWSCIASWDGLTMQTRSRWNCENV